MVGHVLVTYRKLFAAMMSDAFELHLGTSACDGARVPTVQVGDDVELLSETNPLCQAPTGDYTASRYSAGAFPPTRIRQVMQKVGGIVAPICPKGTGAEVVGSAYASCALVEFCPDDQRRRVRVMPGTMALPAEVIVNECFTLPALKRVRLQVAWVTASERQQDCCASD